jgi:ABC-type transport system involved in cytochrome bd biosynthesis fused ATPase/permease subunit
MFVELTRLDIVIGIARAVITSLSVSIIITVSGEFVSHVYIRRAVIMVCCWRF